MPKKANIKSGAPQNPKPKKKWGLGKVLILWIVAVPVCFFAYPTLCLLLAGMLPTLVSAILEKEPGKPRSMSMGSFNICGTVPYIIELWEHYQRFSYLFVIFLDMNSWLIMYGTSFLGYIIYLGVPKIVLGAMRISARTRMRRLQDTQKFLISEWGEEVKPDKRIKPNPDEGEDEEEKEKKSKEEKPESKTAQSS